MTYIVILMSFQTFSSINYEYMKGIDKIDAENSELFLLGDLNCNLLSNTPNSNITELLSILEIYNLSQKITEPTRLTNFSQTLVDLCITNICDIVKSSGVLSIAISDHSLVYVLFVNHLIINSQ